MNRKRTNRVLAIALVLVMAVSQFAFAATIDVSADAVLTVNNVETARLSSGEIGTISYTMTVKGYLAQDTDVIYNTEFTIDADGKTTPVKSAVLTVAAQAEGTTDYPVKATVTLSPEYDNTTVIEKDLTVITAIPDPGKGSGKLQLLGGANNLLSVELVADPIVDDLTDTTAPVVTAPADLTVEATAVLSTVEIGTATATDNKDAAPSITNNAPAAFPLGTTTVTWTATDAAGNSDTAEQKVTVVDTTAPVLTVPADIQKEATDVTTPVDLGTASATDIFPVTVTNDAPAAFALGTTTVTYTATDANGNSSTATQIVTIVDTTAPVLTVPADVTVILTGALTQVNLGVATATDIFGATVTNNAPADGFKIGTTVVTYTANDPNGNSTTGTQKVHVRYANSGILQPINKDGSSQFKLGSTVPVKIQLKDANGNPVSTAVNTITAQKYTNAVLGTVLETVTSTTSSTGNVMRYDATSGQYIFNLSTKGWTSGSYHLTITLDDGTVTKVDISSK